MTTEPGANPMKRSDLIPYVTHVLDDAGTHYPYGTHAPDSATLVGWQCGFEPVVVAVFSYLEGCTVEAEEAAELARDLLTELEWFAGGPSEPDYIFLPTGS